MTYYSRKCAGEKRMITVWGRRMNDHASWICYYNALWSFQNWVFSSPVMLIDWTELGVATVSWQTIPTRKPLDDSPLYVVLGALKKKKNPTMGDVSVQDRAGLSLWGVGRFKSLQRKLMVSKCLAILGPSQYLWINEAVCIIWYFSRESGSTWTQV